MAKVNTNDSRTRNAQNLIESYNEANGDASAYLFIGKPQPWDNDAQPPQPSNNFKELYQVHNDMLSLKRINDTDVHMMIPRVSWTSGAVFDMYRHDYSSTTPSFSGANNLFDAIYYVLSSNNYVYVCLNNNKNKPSLVEPQNISDQPFITSDDYQWLKLYKVDTTTQQNYSTNNLIPIVANDVTQTEPGSVHTILVDDGGSEFTNNPSGPIADVPDYYCNIVGDGTGAVAKVKIRAGIVTEIDIIRPGSGYTYAKLDFVPGRIYKGLAQLDDKRNGLNPLGDGRFRSTVIISPVGGWGYKRDPLVEDIVNDIKTVEELSRQLSARTVCVFANLKDNLSDFFIDTQFRQIGILKEVRYSDDTYQNADTLSAVHSIKVTDVSGPEDFTVGEVVKQTAVYNSVEEEATGLVVSWDNVNNILRVIYNQTTVNTKGQTFKLTGPQNISGLTSTKIVSPDHDYFDDLAGLTFFRGYSQPEIEKYSGYLTYLTNLSPISRNPQQSERVSLTITF